MLAVHALFSWYVHTYLLFGILTNKQTNKHTKKYICKKNKKKHFKTLKYAKNANVSVALWRWRQQQQQQQHTSLLPIAPVWEKERERDRERERERENFDTLPSGGSLVHIPPLSSPPLQTSMVPPFTPLQSPPTHPCFSSSKTQVYELLLLRRVGGGVRGGARLTIFLWKRS